MMRAYLKLTRGQQVLALMRHGFSALSRAQDICKRPPQSLCHCCCTRFSSSDSKNLKYTDGDAHLLRDKKPQELLDEALSSEDVASEPQFPSDVQENKYSDTWRHSQSKHAFRPKIDPRQTSILLFPGQGSQFVGMGKELLSYPNVQDMYECASDILGYDLLDVCLNGPLEKLSQTIHCQPAILVTSLAAVEKLKNTQPWAIEHCITTAGFSIGEYAALVFAGSISFEDALHIVKIRAKEMQKASEATPSGMMTVFLNHKSKLNFACHTARRYCLEKLNIENPVCQVANYLYPECKVIAGNLEALDFIEKNAKEFSLLRTRRVPVSGAFHTHLMSAAKKPLLDAIKTINIETPVIPVHSNVNSFKYKNPYIVERYLAEQVYKPVKWEQTMHVLYSRPQEEQFPFTFEVGPGKQLGSFLKSVNKKAHEQYESVVV